METVRWVLLLASTVSISARGYFRQIGESAITGEVDYSERPNECIFRCASQESCVFAADHKETGNCRILNHYADISELTEAFAVWQKVPGPAEGIMHCLEKPCLNHATCHPLASGYTCNCREGYIGQNCETFVPFVPDGWSLGDGTGGLEVSVGQYLDHNACVEACLTQYPYANGATLDHATHKDCFCEFDQVGVIDNPDWINRRIR